MFRVIAKDELVIIEEYSLPIPYSPALPTRAEALRWISSRGLQRDTKVITESLFQQNNKVIPKPLTDEDIHLSYDIYKAKRNI